MRTLLTIYGWLCRIVVTAAILLSLIIATAHH